MPVGKELINTVLQAVLDQVPTMEVTSISFAQIGRAHV